MDRSYRLGLQIVLGTVALSAALCLARIDTKNAPLRSAEDLGPLAQDLDPFRFEERSGKTVTEADLAEDVWIAAFIFTRCPSSCLQISAVMSRLQGDLAETNVRLVSLTVDPEYDTPEVLDEFASKYRADPDRWWFLTGSEEEVYELIRQGFMLGVAPTTEAEQAAGAEAISHSLKLGLVDRGNRVVGLYSSTEETALNALKLRAEELDSKPPPDSWVWRLPAVNASLNGLCGLLLFAGWVLIRRGQVRAHIGLMASAVSVSALFLACYLVYHAQVGSVPFEGVGPIRLVYFTILLSHTVLAAAVVPLVALTLIRAIRKQFDRHVRIARLTFPVWLYVSITGVLIYLMLYQMDVPTSFGPPLPNIGG